MAIITLELRGEVLPKLITEASCWKGMVMRLGLDFRRKMLLLSVVVLGLGCLPILSVEGSGAEAGTLVVRGFNLMEFTPWGCVPVLSSFLSLGILCSCQGKPAKSAELLTLLVGNLVCYLHGLNTVRAWLEAVGSSPVAAHAGMLLLPLGGSLAIIYALLNCRRISVVWLWR